ncbi:uncharacterized protein LAESUDRAFT_648888 [Laetiporus sulphureus 93-53]|uniref:DNA helicase n=1 Tax=Laetiporus sulphureus 93-53 TaxID=1314785 RepID=A0A165F610_9APHY|nr:uncharacterized protein LAESUDRAFT_648888 [Laetiporus sulphureus 93-53]KZT08459.1 hypothetical protein LAESUDRAFT_648888 [Laetiporus sulphureus 93-53]
MTKLDNAISQKSVFDYAKRYPPLGLLPAALTVKVNAVYRVLCNYAPAQGLVHNARVIVRSMAGDHVTVGVLQGLGGTSMVKAEHIQLPRIELCYELPTGHTLVRQQFPLAPAYATTFNSCQGLTLDRIGVDLTRDVFCHGQLYTMLSRIRHRSHAMIRMMKNETATRNITYSELLA